MNQLPNQTTFEAQNLAEVANQEPAAPQAALDNQHQTEYHYQDTPTMQTNYQQEQIQQNESYIQPQDPAQTLLNQAKFQRMEAPQPEVAQQYLGEVDYQNMGMNQQISQIESLQQQTPQMEVSQQQVSYLPESDQTGPSPQLAGQNQYDQNANLGYYYANNQAMTEQPSLEQNGAAEIALQNYRQTIQQETGVESHLNALNLNDRKKQVSALEIARKTTPCVLRPRDRSPQQPIVRRKQKEVNRPPMTVDQVFIKENMCDHQIVCDICKCESYEEGDEIVICETCNVAVHQSCYGREINDSVPMDDWHCERCKYIKEKKNGDFSHAVCKLCNKNKGCMIRVSLFWYHIQCVNWTSEIYFEDSVKKDKLEGSLAKDECTQVAKDTCVYCKIPDCYCIKCDILGCNEKFCVRCASERGIIKPDDQMDCQKHPELEDVVYIFCERHLTEGINLVQSKAFEKLRLDPVKIEKETQKILQKEKRNANRRKKVRGRNNANKSNSGTLGSRSRSQLVDRHSSNRVDELESQYDFLKNQYAQLSSLLLQTMINQNVSSKELITLTNRGFNNQSGGTSRSRRKSKRSNACKTPSRRNALNKNTRKKKVEMKSKVLPRRTRNSNNRIMYRDVNSAVGPPQSLNEIEKVMNQFNSSMSLNEQKKQKKRSTKAASKKSKPKPPNSSNSFGKSTRFRVSQDVMEYFCFKDEILTSHELQTQILEYFQRIGLYDSESKCVKAFLCGKARKIYNRDIVAEDKIVIDLIKMKHIMIVSPGSQGANQMINPAPVMQPATRASQRVVNQSITQDTKHEDIGPGAQGSLGSNKLALQGLMKLVQQNPQILAQLPQLS
ncbi:unnamed protein product [Moneuplotes crassus]|uniref:PHD-type domain-containing protein n=1 Tax=Euplotes crassus TaxID=5936 RepID=A0AAD2D975_EUPCR|nr:unnamed protein product [Moneuplotes crassus]